MPGGSGGGTTTTSQQVNTNMGPWNEQGPYLKQGFAQAGNLLNNFDPSPKYYPDSTVAAPNQWQNQGLEWTVNKAVNDPLMPAATRTYLDTVGGKFLDPSTNPWLGKTFDSAADSVSRAYSLATAPSTDALFASNNRFGSGSRFNAVRENERTLGESLDKLATSIYGGNFQAERGRQDAATQNVGSMIGASFLAPTAMVNAGGQRQALDQRQLDDLVARWNVEQNPTTKQDALWQQLARYMGVVGSGNWGQSGQTTSYGTQPAPRGSDPFAMGLGALLSAGSVAGKLGWAPFAAAAPLAAVSDARAKRDIKLIGKTNDGQNLYAYRYKGDSRPQIGLMAQEVERTNPDAVITHPSGLKMVDYGRALGWEAFG